MSTFTIKRNDTLPAIRHTLLDGAGAAISLVGCSVRFLARRRADGPILIDDTALVVNAALGIVEYPWDVGDTERAGTYLTEWEVTDGAGDIFTVPSEGYDTLIIDEDLG